MVLKSLFQSSNLAVSRGDVSLSSLVLVRKNSTCSGTNSHVNIADDALLGSGMSLAASSRMARPK